MLPECGNVGSFMPFHTSLGSLSSDNVRICSGQENFSTCCNQGMGSDTIQRIREPFTTRKCRYMSQQSVRKEEKEQEAGTELYIKKSPSSSNRKHLRSPPSSLPEGALPTRLQ